MPVKAQPIKAIVAGKKNNRQGRKSMLITQDIITPSAVSVDDQGTKWLSQNEAMIAINTAVKQEIKRKEEQGLPIAKYDIESQKAYLENADGSREYV